MSKRKISELSEKLNKSWQNYFDLVVSAANCNEIPESFESGILNDLVPILSDSLRETGSVLLKCGALKQWNARRALYDNLILILSSLKDRRDRQDLHSCDSIRNDFKTWIETFRAHIEEALSNAPDDTPSPFVPESQPSKRESVTTIFSPRCNSFISPPTISPPKPPLEAQEVSTFEDETFELEVYEQYSVTNSYSSEPITYDHEHEIEVSAIDLKASKPELLLNHTSDKQKSRLLHNEMKYLIKYDEFLNNYSNEKRIEKDIPPPPPPKDFDSLKQIQLKSGKVANEIRKNSNEKGFSSPFSISVNIVDFFSKLNPVKRKQQEIVIGLPTDVKHIGHVGRNISDGNLVFQNAPKEYLAM